MPSAPSPIGHNQPDAIGPRSRAEFERAKAITPGGSMRAAPYFAPQPPYALRGEGCFVTDLDGRRVLDCANNFFSLIHGHAFPPVVRAVKAALEAGTAFGLPTEAETRLAEAIRDRSPRLEQFRFVSSGTEAVMFALKAARAITKRPAIAKFEGAYHGAYDYAEVSLDPTPQNWGDPPRSLLYAEGTPASVAADVLVLPFNDPAACRRLIAEHHARLAAILFDPLAARVSMAPASAALCEMLQDCCRSYGILMVLDEVVSYRLGHGGAHAVFGLSPDLVALAKIIGGGLPIGAVAGPARHMAVFDHTKGKPPVSHGGTFSANPLSMAAGLVALEAYDPSAVERLNAMGDALRRELSEAFAVHGVPAQVAGMGSLMRLHLKSAPVRDYRTSHPTAAERSALARVQLSMLERGYLLTPNCSAALSTPMGEDDVRGLGEALVAALSDVYRDTPWS